MTQRLSLARMRPLLRNIDAEVGAVEDMVGGASEVIAQDDEAALVELMPVLVRKVLGLNEDLRGVWGSIYRRLAQPCSPADLDETGAWLRQRLPRAGELLSGAVRLCRDAEESVGLKTPRADELAQVERDFQAWSAQVLAAWPSAGWSESVQPDPIRLEQGAQAAREGRLIDVEEWLKRQSDEGA